MFEQRLHVSVPFSSSSTTPKAAPEGGPMQRSVTLAWWRTLPTRSIRAAARRLTLSRGACPYLRHGGTISSTTRDNCSPGLYCDAQHTVCMKMKDLGASCDADKEYVVAVIYIASAFLSIARRRCSTFNCLSSGVCGKSADTPDHVPFWVYIIVGICIFGGWSARVLTLSSRTNV